MFLRDLSHLTATQQHFPSFSKLPKNDFFPSKFDFLHSCAIQSQYFPQHQVSVAYPTSFLFLVEILDLLKKFGLHVSF